MKRTRSMWDLVGGKCHITILDDKGNIHEGNIWVTKASALPNERMWDMEIRGCELLHTIPCEHEWEYSGIRRICSKCRVEQVGKVIIEWPDERED